jgi:hypothetical protein
MRASGIGTGSLNDQVNAVAILLAGLEDIAAIEWGWSRLVRSLESIADRAASVRRRGGIPRIDAVGWLEQVIREHEGLGGVVGHSLQDELLRLTQAIRHRGQGR